MILHHSAINDERKFGALQSKTVSPDKARGIHCLLFVKLLFILFRELLREALHDVRRLPIRGSSSNSLLKRNKNQPDGKK